MSLDLLVHPLKSRAVVSHFQSVILQDQALARVGVKEVALYGLLT